jgi:SAM-dependent methyltransferase
MASLAKSNRPRRWVITVPDELSANPHVFRTASTYASAADHYDRRALSFWDRFGAQTVSRLRLAPGRLVLDVCCGAGASAIPAAQAVGPDGAVIGVDLAGPLLELGRAKAVESNVTNVEFRLADATRLDLPTGPSTRSSASSASSSPPMFPGSSPRCGGSSGPVERSP